MVGSATTVDLLASWSAENVTEGPTFYPSGARVTYAALLTLLALTGVGANLVVLAVIAWTRNSRVSVLSSGFLLNLVVSDLAVSCVMTPLAVHGALNRDVRFDQLSCQALGFLGLFFCTSSILSVSAIAYDRYQAIINCLQYTTHSKLGYVIKGLALIYTQAFLCSAPPLASWGSFAYVDERFSCGVNWRLSDSGYAIFSFVTTFVLPVAVMCFCYMKIIRIARQHLRRITDINMQVMRMDAARGTTAVLDPRGVLGYAMVDPIQRLSLFPEIMVTQSTNEILNESVRTEPGGRNACVEGDNVSSISNTSNVGSTLKKEAKATIRLLGLVLIFIVCWLPYHVVNLYIVSKSLSTGTDTQQVIETFVFLLAVSKSVLNPFLFALGSKRFRYSIRRKLRKKTVKRTENQKLKRRRYQIANQIASLYRNSQADVKTPSDSTTPPTSKASSRKDKTTKQANKYPYKERTAQERTELSQEKHPQSIDRANCVLPLNSLKPLPAISNMLPIFEESLPHALESLRQEHESMCVPYSDQFCFPHSQHQDQRTESKSEVANGTSAKPEVSCSDDGSFKAFSHSGGPLPPLPVPRSSSLSVFQRDQKIGPALRMGQLKPLRLDRQDTAV